MMSKAGKPEDRNEDRGSGGIRTVAVIDIGASAIRMAVAEIDDSGEVRTLESLSQAVSLGKDAFITGGIEKSTIEDCVRVLKVYRQKLDEYGISARADIRVVATSAVREATNRLAFLDRIFIATGFEVEPFDEAELHRVVYLGIQPFLQAHPQLATSRAVLCEVGGGSTEVLVVQGTNVSYFQTYRFGSLRGRKVLEALHTPSVKVRELIENQIDRTAEQIRRNIPTGDDLQFVAMGGDVRFAASKLGLRTGPDQICRIPLWTMREFAYTVAEMSVDDLVSTYHMSFLEAESLAPALLAYIQIAEKLNAKDLIVADVNLRDGLLHEMATHNKWEESFNDQIVRSAVDLGRKFEFDESHAMHVAGLSKQLFEGLKSEHQLPKQFQLTLYIAALLHEIGLFISNRSLHKHSMYLIRHSELFGMGKRDILRVALVARYHRRASPQPTHEGYGAFDRADRVTVAKLAAILRIAKALDDSRSQRIGTLECHCERNRIVITLPRVDDVSMEQIAIRQNVSLFEEIYGKSLIIQSSH